MHHRSRWGLLPCAVVALGIAWGCADAPTGAMPSPVTHAPAAFDLSTPPPASSLAGSVVVCKDTPAGTSATFVFDVRVHMPDGRVFEFGYEIADGDCETVFVSEPDPLVEVWEYQPDGWHLFSVTRTTSGGVTDVFTDGTGLRGSPVSCVVDFERGCLLVFRNEPNEPPPPPPPPPPGNEGCTPGYWKQPQHFDSWVVYNPNQKYNAVFGVTLFANSRSLLASLEEGGGDPERLGRHSVAALLNASSGEVGYGMSAAEVIAAVQAAVAGGHSSIVALSDQLEDLNERSCPLN